jgi:hypothetical protein
MFTRADYLNALHEDQGKAFHRYYGEIVNTVGGPRAFACPFTDEQVREALAAGDEHLNTLPLKRWDSFAGILPPGTSRALKERGDYLTLSVAVCLLKEAARMRVNGSRKAGA